MHYFGTKVTLSSLKKKFNPSDVERYLKEAVPLRAKRFAVYLNGKRITSRYIPGRRFQINVKTIYGPVEGEIVMAVKSSLVDKPSVECRVKQVLIKREFFGLENSHTLGLSRITGEVNADFLPVTSSRNDWLRDSAEFKLFHQLMRVQLEKILKEFKKESDTKQLKKIREELKQAMTKIRSALELHPELTPSGKAVARRAKRTMNLEGSTVDTLRAEAKEKSKLSEISQIDKTGSKENSKDKQPADTKLSLSIPKPEAIKRIRLKKLGVSVALVSLGEEAAEVMSEGNLIYINSDHLLYQKLEKSKDQFQLHLLRLITQEIVMMKKLRLSAKDAFDSQSKLLTDALCSVG